MTRSVYVAVSCCNYCCLYYIHPDFYGKTSLFFVPSLSDLFEPGGHKSLARGNETKKEDTIIIKSFRLFISRHRNHARLAIFALLPGVGRRSDIHLNIVSRNLTRRQILKNGRTILESFPRVIFVKLSLSLSCPSPIRSNGRRKKGRSQITRMQTHLRFPPPPRQKVKTKQKGEEEKGITALI